MGVRDELEAGLERLKTGWFGGAGQFMGNHRDPVCAWLATNATMSSPVNPAVKALHAQLPDHSGCLSFDSCLIVYNNDSTTTVDDVIELYKRAIVEAPLED